MQIDIQFAADELRQLPGAHRLAGKQARLQESQNVVADPVGTSRPGLRRRQSGNPGGVEACLGLVIGWPRHAILVGDLRHRRFVDGDAPQHLVSDLHDAMRSWRRSLKDSTGSVFARWMSHRRRAPANVKKMLGVR